MSGWLTNEEMTLMTPLPPVEIVMALDAEDNASVSRF